MPKGVYERKPRSLKKYPPDLVAMVRQMYESGATQAETAAAAGTTQKVIWRLMRHHGIAARVAAKRDQRGPKNSSWKFSGASYAALHKRVEAARGKPTECSKCGTIDPNESYDWANLTGRYDRIDDYARMCRSCHWKMDGIENNLRRWEAARDQ
jgi:hypothetical protein